MSLTSMPGHDAVLVSPPVVCFPRCSRSTFRWPPRRRSARGSDAASTKDAARERASSARNVVATATARQGPTVAAERARASIAPVKKAGCTPASPRPTAASSGARWKATSIAPARAICQCARSVRAATAACRTSAVSPPVAGTTSPPSVARSTRISETEARASMTRAPLASRFRQTCAAGVSAAELAANSERRALMANWETMSAPKAMTAATTKASDMALAIT